MILIKNNTLITAPEVIKNNFFFCFNSSLSFTSKSRNKTPITGIHNSTTTKMIVTARNLLYPGTWSKKKSVNPMKFFPHDNANVSKATTNKAHLIGFVTNTRPKIANTITTIPM